MKNDGLREEKEKGGRTQGQLKEKKAWPSGEGENGQKNPFKGGEMKGVKEAPHPTPPNVPKAQNKTKKELRARAVSVVVEWSFQGRAGQGQR